MSRHRIVRTMDYKDEYDSYDDVYGHSVDDDCCISPTDASQWIYDRAKGQQSISAFMANNRNIQEENEDEDDDDNADDAEENEKKRRDSENFQMPVLDDIEQAKLLSCIDEIRSVVGDTISERQIVETAMKYNYDVTRTLDDILNTTSNSSSQLSGKSLLTAATGDINTTAKSLKNVSITAGGSASSSGISDKDFEKRNENVNKTNISKLNEYLKNNLKISKNNNTTTNNKSIGFILPKLNLNNSQSVQQQQQQNDKKTQSKLNQFLNNKLNKINSTSSISNSTVPEPSSSSSPLSLSSTSFKNSFQLPNLRKLNCNSVSLNTDDEFSLENSLNKTNSSIEEKNKKQNVRNNDNDSTFIDLTKILKKSTKQNELIENDEKKRQTIKVSDNIETIDYNSNKLSNCQINLFTINNLTRHFKSNSLCGRPSNFAKILNFRYKCDNAPIITHNTKPKNNLKRFVFNTKSPDDLNFERKRKK